MKEAERRYNSTAAKYQEEEGPPVAKKILDRLGARESLIEEVCDIIGQHHHPRLQESIEFKTVYDADMITNLEEKQKKDPVEPEKLAGILEKSFLTKSGGELARKVLLPQPLERRQP
jgi:hypothetical protein